MKIDRVCIEPMTPLGRDDAIVGIVRAVQSVRVAVGTVGGAIDTAAQSRCVTDVVVVALRVAPRAARATSRPSVRLKPMRVFLSAVSSFRQSHREATGDA